jgi:hypothetical protein
MIDAFDRHFRYCVFPTWSGPADVVLSRERGGHPFSMASDLPMRLFEVRRILPKAGEFLAGFC